MVDDDVYAFDVKYEWLVGIGGVASDMGYMQISESEGAGGFARVDGGEGQSVDTAGLHRRAFPTKAY